MNKIFSLILLLAMPLTAADYYVSPQGSDSGSGSAEKPFKNIAKAQAAARGGEADTIILKGGMHYLPETLVLESADSNLHIKAAEGEQAVISGGLSLDLTWQPWKDGIFMANTPAGLDIDQFFCNGKRQHMARYPDYDANAFPYNGAAADAFSPQRAARWKSPAGGFIHAMHRAGWGGYHYRITGKDSQHKVKYEGGWQNNRQMGMHRAQRFVENIFEELNAPGEWFHDKAAAKIYFKPPAGTDLNSATFEIARLAHLVELRGTQQLPLKKVTFSGITFRHAARTFMDSKEPLLRSDWTIYRGGAFFLTGTEDCLIDKCEFDQLGGNVIFASNYNRRLTIRGSHIHGAGASAICFVGDPAAVRNPLFEYHQRQEYSDIDRTPGPKSDNYPADSLVEDCLIHDIGIVEKQAAGVQVSMASRITIRHCSIYDVGRAGINFSEGTFGGHIIEFCDVFDTVLETDDHGSFNSWGRDRFWHLKGAPAEELPQLALLDCEKNIIRNSRWRCDHGWDVDLDDGSSNYDITNNLFLNRGLKLREGFKRRVWNNIAVNNTLHPHVWYKNSGDIIEKNIWMRPYASIRATMTPLVDNNFFTTESAMKKFQHHGADRNSTFGDPLFIDPANGDFRVRENSPALKTGFKNFPMDKFGVSSPRLKALARTPEIPSLILTAEKNTKTASAVMPFYWQGARLEELKGEAYSAFGVSKEAGGLQISALSKHSPAAAAGLKKGDLILKINEQNIKKLTDLRQVIGAQFQIAYVRGQANRKLEFKGMSISVATDDQAPVLNSRSEIAAFTAVPATSNQPLSSLKDEEVQENYGPVFANGVNNGLYIASFKEEKSIRRISSSSFNMGGSRGAQFYTLYAAASPAKPRSLKNLIALCTVDSRAQNGKFTQTVVELATAVKAHHLVWAVHAPNGHENSAYQEFSAE